MLSSDRFLGAVVALWCATGTLPVVLAEAAVPSITIGQDADGHDVTMPLLGAGTWQYNDTIAYQSVCQALQAGYTMIDTAWGYHNQVGVGLAIQDCWQGQQREDLFVLTKLPGGLTPQMTIAMHYQNLWELQLDYVDHLMTHFPSDWEQKYTGKEHGKPNGRRWNNCTTGARRNRLVSATTVPSTLMIFWKLQP